MSTRRSRGIAASSGATCSRSDVAACLGRARLFVGNDSGLMHVAAAAGAPTLGLFGPSPERRYAPWGRLARSVRCPESFEELVARAIRGERGYGVLMESLAVDTVEAAARELLAAGPPPAGEDGR